MMRVLAPQVVDVQRDVRVVDEPLEELMCEVDVERAYHRARERHVEFEPGATREVDDDARQRLVERRIRMAEARQSGLVAERLAHRLSERDSDVLHGVVGIDVEVACRCYGNVEEPVACELVQHVIEKRHAGGDFGTTCAVEVHGERDLRFARIALDFRCARVCHDQVNAATAASSAAFSSGVPTVIRRQCSSNGCTPWRFLTRIRACRNASNQRGASGTRASTKLVRVGNTVTPGSPASAVSIRVRSATSCADHPARRSRSANSTGATACSIAWRLYGWRTLSNCAIHSGAATA